MDGIGDMRDPKKTRKKEGGRKMSSMRIDERSIERDLNQGK